MKNIFKIFVITVLGTIGGSLICQTTPFVLNQSPIYTDKISGEITAVVNSLPNYHLLAEKFGNFDPTLHPDRPMGNINLRISYHRFSAAVGLYMKYTPQGGVYALGWKPQGGGMIVGYDPNQARAVQHQWKYLQLNVILCRRQWTNIGFEMNLIPTDGAIPYYRVTDYKTFDRLSYSVGVACPSLYFIPFPVTWEASIAYTVKPPCFILGEIQNTSKPYDGDNNPEGYVLLGGIGVDILRNFRGILFYQVYKNNFDYDVPYTRFDRRFGTQIQFHVQ